MYGIKNRPDRDRIQRRANCETFSVGISELPRGPALYRVKGPLGSYDATMALADRLAAWMNANHDERSPREVSGCADDGATLHVTKAGRAAGFLGAKG